MAQTYTVNARAVERARELIEARQYVLDSDWGEAQPRAAAENAQQIRRFRSVVSCLITSHNG